MSSAKNNDERSKSRTPRIVAASSAVMLAGGSVAFAFAVQMGAMRFDPAAFITEGESAGPIELQSLYAADQVQGSGEANRQAEAWSEDRDSRPEGGGLAPVASAQGGSETVLPGIGDGRGGFVAGRQSSAPGASGRVWPRLDPDAPDFVDPDPADSTLPKDFLFDGSYEAFPAGGLAALQGGDAQAPRLAFFSEDGVFSSEPELLNLEPLYRGMYLDKRKILNAGYFYAWIPRESGLAGYRLLGFGENFQVGEGTSDDTFVADRFERVLSDGATDITLDFRFRLNPSSAWQYETVTFPVHKAKVKLIGYGGETVQSIALDGDEPADLGPRYADMLSEDVRSAAVFDAVVLDEMFVGWAERAGGEPVGPTYLPEDAFGAYRLEPLPLAAVPEGYEVVATIARGELDPGKVRQELSGYDPAIAGEQCRIPEGVQGISRDVAQRFGDDDASGVVVRARTIHLPKSLTSVPLGALVASDAFTVEEGNGSFWSEGGVLFQRGAAASASASRYEGAQIVGVPTAATSLVVPSGVEAVHLPQNSALTEIHFEGAPLRFADSGLEALASSGSSVKVYVPAGATLDYLDAWHGSLENAAFELVEEDGDVRHYDDGQDAVYLDGGHTLVRAYANAEGVFIVPDSVTRIASGAFASCSKVHTVVLGRNVASIEPGAFGSSVPRILAQGPAPQDVSPDLFDGRSVVVAPEALSSWSGLATSASSADSLQPGAFELLETADGFTLLVESSPDGAERNAVLLKAPRDIRSFRASSLPGVTITGINAGAFEGCADLRFVDLPASVTSIGPRAFADCPALDAFYSRAQDTIQLGGGVFSGSGNLSFVVFNAMQAQVDAQSNILDRGSVEDPLRVFAPYGAAGYQWDDAWSGEVEQSCTAYELMAQGGGFIVYGENDSDPAYWQQGIWVVEATKDVSGEIALGEGLEQLDGSFGVTAIENGAFRGCSRTFWFKDGTDANIVSVGSYALAYSGFAGDLSSLSALEWIDNGAFQQSGATGVLDQESLQHIGDYAFLLSGVTGLGDCPGLDSIGSGAFYGSALSGSVVLSDSVTSVRANAFGLTEIEAVSIGAGLTEIGEGVFQGCESLREVSFAEECGLVSVGESAFEGSGLRSIIIPDTVVSIGDSAFSSCLELERIVLPRGLQSIGSFAFAHCEPLSAVDLPASLESIGYGAFMGTQVPSIALSSSRPPELMGFGTRFAFKDEDGSDGGFVRLVDAAMGKHERFAAAWAREFAEHEDPFDYSDFSDEELLAGYNAALKVLGQVGDATQLPEPIQEEDDAPDPWVDPFDPEWGEPSLPDLPVFIEPDEPSPSIDEGEASGRSDDDAFDLGFDTPEVGSDPVDGSLEDDDGIEPSGE